MLRRMLKGAAYGAAQTAKIGWYSAHYVGSRHLAGPITPPGEVPRPYGAPRASDRAVREAFTSLISREAKDIARGVYGLPRDMRTVPNPLRLMDLSRRYFADTKALSRRAMRKGGATEVRDLGAEEYPTYYLQNFHFQTDGWLSDESADLYDTQVETIFTGLADTMRRRALPLLLAEIDGNADEGRRPVVADFGCGTGRLLRDILDNRPEIDAVGVDLSPAYLAKASGNVRHDRAAFLQAAAEGLPFDDNSVDVLYSVFLFHELPPKIRGEVAAEFARVLRPGGLYVHVDSVQYGDTAMDMMLEGFPRIVHEPYYDGYAREDLAERFGAVGFAPEPGEEVAFLTKISPFRLKEA